MGTAIKSLFPETAGKVYQIEENSTTVAYCGSTAQSRASEGNCGNCVVEQNTLTQMRSSAKIQTCLQVFALLCEAGLRSPAILVFESRRTAVCLFPMNRSAK